MNIIKRTCATCAAFNPSATGDEEVCGNLTVNLYKAEIGFITENHGTPQAVNREPGPTNWCGNHQTHEEDAAETHDIEMARCLAESTPEFMAAMSACLRLVKTLGEEHPDAMLAMQRAMMLAPPSMKAFMAEQAQELGLIPAADGYTDDGEPVYSLESIAEKLDVSMEEARETMDAMLAERAELGLPAALVDPATVHRKH